MSLKFLGSFFLLFFFLSFIKSAFSTKTDEFHCKTNSLELQSSSKKLSREFSFWLCFKFHHDEQSGIRNPIDGCDKKQKLHLGYQEIDHYFENISIMQRFPNLSYDSLTDRYILQRCSETNSILHLWFTAMKFGSCVFFQKKIRKRIH